VLFKEGIAVGNILNIDFVDVVFSVSEPTLGAGVQFRTNSGHLNWGTHNLFDRSSFDTFYTHWHFLHFSFDYDGVMIAYLDNSQVGTFATVSETGINLARDSAFYLTLCPGNDCDSVFAHFKLWKNVQVFQDQCNYRQYVDIDEDLINYWPLVNVDMEMENYEMVDKSKSNLVKQLRASEFQKLRQFRSILEIYPKGDDI